jgi:hypothetical protein
MIMITGENNHNHNHLTHCLKPSTSIDSTPEQRELARDKKLAELKDKGYEGAELDNFVQSWFLDTEWYKGLEATINARFENTGR